MNVIHSFTMLAITMLVIVLTLMLVRLHNKQTEVYEDCLQRFTPLECYAIIYA